MEIRIREQCGDNIEQSVKRLKDAAKNIRNAMIKNGVDFDVTDAIICTLNFNDKIITSEDSVDDAYIKIVGKTKAESEEDERREKLEYEKTREEWRKSILSMTERYIQKAKGVIREDKEDYWAKIVPIRLSDIYLGMELNCMLQILQEWNKTHSFKKCHELIFNQGHSGWTHSLVVSLVGNFAKGERTEVKKLVEILSKKEYNEKNY